MSSTDAQLRTFLANDGTTTYQGQQNGGTWQASTGQPSSGQQSWESFDAFAVRESVCRAISQATVFR